MSRPWDSVAAPHARVHGGRLAIRAADRSGPRTAPRPRFEANADQFELDNAAMRAMQFASHRRTESPAGPADCATRPRSAPLVFLRRERRSSLSRSCPGSRSGSRDRGRTLVDIGSIRARPCPWRLIVRSVAIRSSRSQATCWCRQSTQGGPCAHDQPSSQCPEPTVGPPDVTRRSRCDGSHGAAPQRGRISAGSPDVGRGERWELRLDDRGPPLDRGMRRRVRRPQDVPADHRRWASTTAGLRP